MVEAIERVERGRNEGDEEETKRKVKKGTTGE